VSTDQEVVVAVARDPRTAGRPLYVIPYFEAEALGLEADFELIRLMRIETPYGFEERGTGMLYELRLRTS
jgi:hypothetical protein